jgi:two-component sensor histidine kinase
MQGADRTTGLMRLQRALPRVGGVGAFIAGATAVALAGILHGAFDSTAQEPLPPFITFYPAVVIASLCGGPRVGLAAAVITLLIAWYFWIPEYESFLIVGAAMSMTVAIYAIAAVLLALIIGAARLSLDRVAESEAERGLAARESVHRIKNLIAVVQALASKIEREVTTPEEFRNLLTQRLAALDRAQNVLVREDWNDVDLGEVIDGALAPFLPNPGMKLTRGPDAIVPARYVSGLCLALYELSTNAMKYGALAGGRGPVNLSWRCENGACLLEWREQRANAGAIENSGFGTLLIKSALSRDRDTRVDYEFTPSEVVAVFRWPTPQS